jgi:hypothetical protein
VCIYELDHLGFKGMWSLAFSVGLRFTS